jgi:hypothetical protein
VTQTPQKEERSNKFNPIMIIYLFKKNQMINAGCDPLKKQNGRRQGDLFPHPREGVLPFGTFL